LQSSWLKKSCASDIISQTGGLLWQFPRLASGRNLTIRDMEDLSTDLATKEASVFRLVKRFAITLHITYVKTDKQ
jgi:hypothetical protein